MVDVMQEVAIRVVHVPPFYVSFVLVTLASYLSEGVTSQYCGAKTAQKTITIAFTTLEGALDEQCILCLSFHGSRLF